MIALQVLIIAGLLLSLVWFLIDRMKHAPVEVEEKPTAPIAGAEEQAPVVTAVAAGAPVLTEAAPPPQAAPPAVPIAIGEPTAEGSSANPSSSEAVPAAATQSNPSALSAEEAAAKEQALASLNEESAGLKDKVKYLESRLMEYEIVQEEISSLGALREENEKLKSELFKLQGGSVAAKADVLVAATASPDVLAPAEPTIPPSAEPSPSAQGEGQIDNILKKLDELTTPKS